MHAGTQQIRSTFILDMRTNITRMLCLYSFKWPRATESLSWILWKYFAFRSCFTRSGEEQIRYVYDKRNGENMNVIMLVMTLEWALAFLKLINVNASSYHSIIVHILHSLESWNSIYQSYELYAFIFAVNDWFPFYAGTLSEYNRNFNRRTWHSFHTFSFHFKCIFFLKYSNKQIFLFCCSLASVFSTMFSQ